MPRRNLPLILTTLFLSIGIYSCVSLRQINEYSSTSLAGIEKFENIDYTFTRHCLDACLFNAMRNFEIKREEECNCDLYKTADSVTLLIYNAIRGYFSGLAHISNNELTAYDPGALQKALTEGNFWDIKIEKEHVDAYTNIYTILLRATADLYRKKKIKQYIEEANQPIQVLIQKFQFILQKNLEGELNFKMEKLYAYYKEMSLNENITDYEKGKATVDYYQQLSAITREKDLIDAFAKSLTTISDGHQKLYDNRNKLTSKEIKELMKQYASNVQDITTEFNKLKK